MILSIFRLLFYLWYIYGQKKESYKLINKVGQGNNKLSTTALWQCYIFGFYNLDSYNVTMFHHVRKYNIIFNNFTMFNTIFSYQYRNLYVTIDLVIVPYWEIIDSVSPYFCNNRDLIVTDWVTNLHSIHPLDLKIIFE